MIESLSSGSRAQWYAVWTRSRHEQVVWRQLVQKRIEAFLPLVTRWSAWKDRRKRIDWPLFPGYCFARFDVDERVPVLSCTGVVNIVSFGGSPAPIPEVEMHSLRVLAQSEEPFDACSFLAEGDFVEVMQGPLRGIVGRLLTHDQQRATVVLSVDVIGQGVRVSVDADHLALCEAFPPAACAVRARAARP